MDSWDSALIYGSSVFVTHGGNLLWGHKRLINLLLHLFLILSLLRVPYFRSFFVVSKIDRI